VAPISERVIGYSSFCARCSPFWNIGKYQMVNCKISFELSTTVSPAGPAHYSDQVAGLLAQQLCRWDDVVWW
jgi:hypothetical protein